MVKHLIIHVKVLGISESLMNNRKIQGGGLPGNYSQHWLEDSFKDGCSLFCFSLPANNLEYRCSINQSRLQAIRHSDLTCLFWVSETSPGSLPRSLALCRPYKGSSSKHMTVEDPDSTKLPSTPQASPSAMKLLLLVFTALGFLVTSGKLDGEE